jgi:hypothetical protein
MFRVSDQRMLVTPGTSFVSQKAEAVARDDLVSEHQTFQSWSIRFLLDRALFVLMESDILFRASIYFLCIFFREEKTFLPNGQMR